MSGRQNPPVRRALGLMSGTSMDGVDAAILMSDGETVAGFGATALRPYGAEERALLDAALDAAEGLSDRGDRRPELAAAEAAIEAAHVAAVSALLRQAGLGARDIDVIGFHGHTALHDPARRLSVQLGDGERLARAVGIDVVWDMRAADVSAGGQGAPLAPVFHRALADGSGIARPAAMVNIGGVANVTWLSAEGAMLAFDSGPGNGLIDDLVRTRTGRAMDKAGALASRGKVDETVLGTLLAHPFFEVSPPKSLDRRSFSIRSVADLGLEDAAATLTAFTAATIIEAARHMPVAPRAWILSGGGARNPALLAAIRARADAPVATARDHGWSEDFIEAQAFAFLAVRSLRGLPLTFPSTTGVAEPLTGGRLAHARRPRALGAAVPDAAKQVSPSAERNLAPIIEVLASRLPEKGLVVEIASGTGQHVCAFARRFPTLTFQPSDANPLARASIEAWRAEAGAENLLAPFDLDVTAPAWWTVLDTPAVALIAINLIHISPWTATEGLFAGAGPLLAEGGVAYLYGPFMRDGAHTAPSNAAFDASLRHGDPAWGLRDIDDVADVAARNGLHLKDVVAMPANNFSLIFRKAPL